MRARATARMLTGLRFGRCACALAFVAVAMPWQVLSCEASGVLTGVIAGMEWAVADARQNPSVKSIISLSINFGFSSAQNRAVQAAHDAGVVVVVSAGTVTPAMDACGESPASAAAAITVGLTISGDQVADWSNTGPCTYARPSFGLPCARLHPAPRPSPRAPRPSPLVPRPLQALWFVQPCHRRRRNSIGLPPLSTNAHPCLTVPPTSLCAHPSLTLPPTSRCRRRHLCAGLQHPRGLAHLDDGHQHPLRKSGMPTCGRRRGACIRACAPLLLSALAPQAAGVSRPGG